MSYVEMKQFNWLEEFDGKSLRDMKGYINSLCDIYKDTAVLKVVYGWENVYTHIEVEREPTFEELTAEKIKKEKKEKADRAKFEKLKSEYGW